ncbi:PqqA binding protein [Eubacterium callanderi]|nr:PqqA binding protein [Eubacterium callanderi]WPK71020.1 PqqA binding protein [Eubacterium callanderi]
MLRQVADEYVVVPIGETVLDFNGMINLTESAGFLWKCLEKEQTVDELVSCLQAEYEVDAKTAEKDIAEFLEKLKQNGFLKD